MESNLLLEQYSWYKKQQLAKSPFKCLLNADIEPNPHQVNAFCAAIQALKTGGIILADEVGLGKTIEAGLVLNYVLDNGAKKVLISLPATLRKQWEVELLEKFGRQAVILDRYTVEHDLANVQTHLGNADEVSIVIASYDYSSKLIKRFPHVKWDFLIIDEAHNLRNVFHGTKRAKNLYDLTHGIPKILLTATPLQNSLTDLHGLVSFIDPRIFGSEKVFNRRFVDGCDYEELKQELLPVLYRTLRRDVGKYMAFSKRTCITVDFHLTAEEKELYDVTNDFLRRDPLYSIPNANRGLIILVIRKLLASSSFALIETFEVLEKRLEKLYEGTKSAYAQEGFDLFWGFVEDEIDEEGFNEYDDEETAEKKQAIQAELKIVRHILEMARAIKTNAKIAALRKALKSAFDHQISEGLNQKAVVFTESKRTQKYIAAELRRSGYSEEDILLFNGDFDDAMTKEIFRTWQVKNFGKTNYGRSVEYKHAIVDYFKSHAKILIVTDAGSEGLNLQFCSTIINYDLPWNPQKIEQRIGRCHRYGQTHDVVAINLFTEIKQMEYNAITHHADPVYASNKKHFKAEEDPLPDYLLPYFKRVIRITRLREVRVLLGFTRVDAPDPDADEQTNIVYLNKGKTEKWLPAAEVHGEGVFIEFNRDSIDAWLRDPELGALSQKYAQCYKEFCESKEWTVTTLRDARYVLMHTFAHLLIKQMSMSSGYSSSAIRERIYFGDDMSGVLLYTGSADKEGSLGGLVELGNIDQLIVLMKDAFQEALVCTNDPECLNNVPAGNNSNGAACHSCCMISETACENGNRMLDRGLIVPIDGRENQSYFKTLVEELCQLEV